MLSSISNDGNVTSKVPTKIPMLRLIVETRDNRPVKSEFDYDHLLLHWFMHVSLAS